MFHLSLLLIFKQLFTEHAINARDDLALSVFPNFHLGEGTKSLVSCEYAQFRKNLNRSAVQVGGAPASVAVNSELGYKSGQIKTN